MNLKIIKIKIFTLLFFSFFVTKVSAQSYTDTFFDALFSYRVELADSLLQNSKPKLSKTEIFLSETFILMFRYENADKADTAVYNNCSRHALGIINSLKNKRLTDKEVFYYTIGMGILIKLKMDKKHYFSVARDLYGLNFVIDYIKANEYKDVRFSLISGIYNYYSALAKEEYPVMRAVLFLLPDGDKAHGLRLLEDCTKNSSVFISTYSLYILARIYHRDEKIFSKSNFFFNELLKRYPMNCTWRKEYESMLKYFKKTDLAKNKRKN